MLRSTKRIAGLAFIAIWLGYSSETFGLDRLSPVAVLKPSLQEGLRIVHILDVKVEGNLLYAVGYGGVTVFDVGDPTAAQQLGNVNPFDSATETFYYRLAVRNGFLYVTRRQAGLEIVDATDPSSPCIVGRYAFEEGPGYETVTRTGDTLCLGAYDRGVDLIGISDPLHPELLASVPTARAFAAVLKSGILYVADLEEGFLVFDVRDLANPRRIARDAEAAGAQFVDVDGDLACVALGSGGVRIYDVSDPASPALLSALPGLAFVVHLDLQGDRLFLAEFGELEVYDLTDPPRPVRIGRQPSPECTFGVTASGDVVYLADWDAVRVYRLQQGAEADLLVEPSFLSFGAFVPGRVERQTFWCENVGNVDLEAAILAPDSTFGVEPDSLTLAPGEGRAVEVVFHPTVPDKIISELSIQSNDADEPDKKVPLLAGTGDFGPGDEAPDFSAENALDGQIYSLSGLRGKPVFLTFFAGW